MRWSHCLDVISESYFVQEHDSTESESTYNTFDWRSCILRKLSVRYVHSAQLQCVAFNAQGYVCSCFLIELHSWISCAWLKHWKLSLFDQDDHKSQKRGVSFLLESTLFGKIIKRFVAQTAITEMLVWHIAFGKCHSEIDVTCWILSRNIVGFKEDVDFKAFDNHPKLQHVVLEVPQTENWQLLYILKC